MKINFTLFGAGLTGGTFNLVEPAQRLAERGHDVTVTTIGRPADFAWFVSRKQPKFRMIWAGKTSSLAYRMFRRATRGSFLFPLPQAEIRDLMASMPECDVNIATAAPTAHAVHQSGKGSGFYYIQHYDSFFGKDSAANNLHDESYFLPLTRLSVSSWLKWTVEERLHTPVSHIITAGIDETVFRPINRKKAGKKQIISLGRKVDWKGFGALEEAMRRIMKKRHDVEWVVYSAHDTPESKSDAPFTLVKSPYGKDLAELYASCDIAVNPSWHEGFAQPALEAMACGLAVVTTSAGAEDFAEAGKNCLVVQPKNPDAIESALERLLEDDALRAQLGEAALETAKGFYWDRVIDKWEAALK